MDIILETNKAVEFVKQKKYKQAENIYLNILKESNDNPIILNFLGYLYLTTKKYTKAESFFEKSHKIQKSESCLAGLALSKLYLRNVSDLIDIYIELLDKYPKLEYYIKFTSFLADLITTNKTEYAPLCYKYSKEAHEQYPFSKEILLNLSISYVYTGKFAEGQKYCYAAIRIDKQYCDAWNFLGYILEGFYLDEKGAQNCYRKSIKYGDKLSGFYNMAISLSKEGKFKLANSYFNKALKLKPDDQIILRDKAYNYLKHRNFKYGYKLFIKQNGPKVINQLKNSWDGKTHKNKTILVCYDMCYGDQIFFSRYITFLKNKFKKVKVLTVKPLLELFKDSFEGIDFVENIPKDYDYYTTLSKLPYYLKMDFNNVPFPKGYLYSDSANIKSEKLKIGICWQAGNSSIRTTIHRSMNLKEFLPILQSTEFEIYSFQVGATNKKYLNDNVCDLEPKLKTFADTARYIKSMDIIISVDTSVANLAGALGVKTFLLLPYFPDWRWFDNTEKTEWYDSVKIFKQTKKNDWSPEIQRILEELTKINKK